jgi:thymidylate kinase
VWDDTFGIYRSKPELELILLCFREALKIRNRDLIKLYVKNRVEFSENTVNEYNWLRYRSSNEEIKIILKDIFENYQPIYQIITGKFNRIELGKLSGLIRKEFKRFRQFSALSALLRRWYREVSVKSYRKLSMLLNRPVVSHRINPRGGLVIAVIGADGSGKSTVSANLHNTFNKKLDVYKIYFGRGAGKVSLPRKILLRFKKLIVPSESKKFPRKRHNVSKKKTGFITNVYKCLEALLVANEKRRNLKLMQAAKRKGMLVICDRFPQNQVMGYNDGPLLHHLSKSSYSILRAISKWEARVYALAENNPPDLLFKLIADAKVVEARKPGETPLDALEAKIEGVRSLKLAAGCKVVTIDATEPLDRVLSTIKNKIWEAYL